MPDVVEYLSFLGSILNVSFPIEFWFGPELLVIMEEIEGEKD